METIYQPMISRVCMLGSYLPPGETMCQGCPWGFYCPDPCNFDLNSNCLGFPIDHQQQQKICNHLCSFFWIFLISIAGQPQRCPIGFIPNNWYSAVTCAPCSSGTYGDSNYSYDYMSGNQWCRSCPPGFSCTLPDK